ncbi:MAG: hypothetical protein JKY65_03810 [Planctomycetes bacterium]|nr:hypothetical protein [Planctomycetota bacterium]
MSEGVNEGVSEPGSLAVKLSYGLPSGVEWGDRAARVRLAGARERPQLSYRGRVREPLVFRELLGALYDVVLADFRWRPTEQREAFQRWLVRHLDRENAARQDERLASEQRRFLQYRFDLSANGEEVLDPVCSVHPDQLGFEVFSRDGSAYARVGVDRAQMEEQGEVVCGTTNVDFSTGLYESIRRLRSIFPTELALGAGGEPISDPGRGAKGLEVSTPGRGVHHEKRIDLPEGWLRGFVQIGAAFLLPTIQIDLQPVHVYDLCRAFRLRKAKTSPRALRWDLEPGQPAVAVLEPWEERLVFHGSTHTATEHRIVRTWGRRRLCLLERTIPVCDRFRVHLLGRGLPYFVTAQGGGLDFTLGLSGWTKADWSSTARFDALVARRGSAGEPSKKPLAWLKDAFCGTPDQIAAALDMSLDDVHASLSEASGRGEVIYDLLHGLYRYRPLLSCPLPESVTLGGGPEEREAQALVRREAIVVTGTRSVARGREVSGRATVDPTHVYEPRLVLDGQGRVVEGACGCPFAKLHGFKAGLCAHQLGLLQLDG